jgi:hypothetical protein
MSSDINTGQVPAHEAGLHLSVINVVCPSGHTAGTQKASGSKMRCSRCWQQKGIEVMMTVPARDGSASADKTRPPGLKPAIRNQGREAPPRQHQCSGCRGVITLPAAAGYDRPRGWLSLSVRVPPELAPNGKGFRYVGQWCCVACLAVSIPGLARAEQTARDQWPAEPPERMPADPISPPASGGRLTHSGSELTDLSRLMAVPANRSARR